MVYVAGRLRHHQRCLHRFCHQLCGPDFPNRSTKCQPHLIFNLPRLKCLIHPVNIFHMMVSLLLHVSTPKNMTAANCNMRNPGVVFVAKQAVVFYPFVHSSSSHCSLLFSLSSLCHYSDPVSCLQLSLWRRICSQSSCLLQSVWTYFDMWLWKTSFDLGGGPVMLRLPWEWLMGGLGRFNVAAAGGSGGDVVLDCAQAYMWGNQ